MSVQSPITTYVMHRLCSRLNLFKTVPVQESEARDDVVDAVLVWSHPSPVFLYVERSWGCESPVPMRPRYLNCRTDLSTSPYAENVRPRAARLAAATACWRRAAVALTHVAEASWAGVPAVETCIPHSRHLR